MPKIARKHQKIFSSSAINNGQFGSAIAGTKVTTNDLDVIQALTAFDEGWQSAILGNKRPALEEMQGLHYLTTTQLAYLFQEGLSEWDVSTTYYQYGIVKKTGTYELYGSLVNDNTGNALPIQTDDANWKYLGDLSNLVNIGTEISLVYNDTGVANAYQLGATQTNPSSYTDGLVVIFKAANSSTAASTIQVAALGTKNLTLSDGTAISNEIIQNQYYIAIYRSGTDRFELFKDISTASNQDINAWVNLLIMELVNMLLTSRMHFQIAIMLFRALLPARVKLEFM
jgi:hypothetical protein